MDNILKQLADAMFPDVDSNIEIWEQKYPARQQGQCVTRFAPSPTGFVHIGGVYMSLLNKNIAMHKNGICFLRIEDTDQVRIIENGVSQIVNTLKRFGIEFDEGQISDAQCKGNYGPYKQSERKDIYQSFAKYLVENGLAYPCFCTDEEVDKIKQRQIDSKSSFIGYGGKDAVCRFIAPEIALERIKNGEPFVTRFKAPIDANRVSFDDLIRGKIEMDDNKIDIPIIKTGGLPTYHFAHLVDDHLMRTTHVVRGDEWLSSVPLHLQLFKAFGFKPPKYAHISPIDKLENGNRRKISKRKDPEARADFFVEQGYPIVAVKEYLYNIMNSRFEIWRKQNPNLSYENFEVKLSEMSASGSLFDFAKLENVSKKIIKSMTDEQVFALIKDWAKIYSKSLLGIIEKDEQRFINSISIWHKNRMDIAKWDEIEGMFKYLYDENFANDVVYEDLTNFKNVKDILSDFVNSYDDKVEEQVWFENMKQICEKYNYATNMKEFKEMPEKFAGSVVDATAFLRVALTGKKDSPNIYQIMHFVGKDETLLRVKKLIEKL